MRLKGGGYREAHRFIGHGRGSRSGHDGSKCLVGEQRPGGRRTDLYYLCPLVERVGHIEGMVVFHVVQVVL